MGPTARIEALVCGEIVLLDGAWGTEMQARGLAPGDTPDLWNLTHPERVEAVARSYVDAGSRIILTNTFRANRLALDRSPERTRVVEINRAGVTISRRAAADRALVFASIGPSGKLLPARETTEAELAAAFAEQARALAEAGADGLVVETMTDLVEARIAVTAAVATGLPVAACMAFDAGKQRDRTMMGVTPAEAARRLVEAGAQVVGANCGLGMEQAVPLCEAFAAATDRPIWIKPNAGIPEFAGGTVLYRTTPDEFASYAPRLIAAGAKFLGGCCGTTPQFIAALHRHLHSGVKPGK